MTLKSRVRLNITKYMGVCLLYFLFGNSVQPLRWADYFTKKSYHMSTNKLMNLTLT